MKDTWKIELRFWLLFFLLNFILFVPAYLANIERASFFPIEAILQSSPIQIGKGLLYNRSNMDAFRWSIEFSMLFFLAIGLGRIKKPLRRFLPWLVASIYLVLLVYQGYHQAFYALYQTPPFFYNDFGLLKVGGQIFLNDFNTQSALLVLALLILVVVIYKGIRFLLYQAFDHRISRLSMGVILLMSLESMVLLFRWGYQAWPEHVPQFQVAPILKNIAESREAQQEMKQMNIPQLIQHRPYESVELEKYPNFFFLFVESYGRLVHDEENLQKDYTALLPKLEAALRDSQWHSTSILSTAPVSGGASWVSYSTFLDGFDFKNRGTFWALLQNESFMEYQHFPRLLQSKGYRNYRLSAIGGSSDMEIPWDTYTRFYAVDEWITYEDFDYRGLLYGWGPSPPDQFSLYFADDHIRDQQAGEPFSLFFITQNSHNPFICPDTIASDWRSLNDSTVNQQKDSRIFEQPVLANYQQAIEYQLSFITDFIQKKGKADDIFIVVGDHQPPLFPQVGAGFETPLHIISKDASFIQGFAEQQFSPGLLIDDLSVNIRHEGFYSLIMHHLVLQYGKEKENIPPYLPNGFQIGQ